MDGYLIVVYKLMCLTDKRDFAKCLGSQFRLLLRGYSAIVVQRRGYNVPDKWEVFFLIDMQLISS